MAFFTDFKASGHVGLLDWYTVSVAVFAVIILAAHGATYLTLKTEGPVHDRSRMLSTYLWAAVLPLFVAISVESWFVRPEVPGHAVYNPVCWAGLLVVVVSTVTLASGLRARREMRAFVGSNLLLVGLLATGGAAIFPVMLHPCAREFTDRSLRRGRPECSPPRRHVVAGGLRAGRFVFRFHLTTLRGASQRPAGQPRVLLGEGARLCLNACRESSLSGEALGAWRPPRLFVERPPM
jgi:hypothetical protein